MSTLLENKIFANGLNLIPSIGPVSLQKLKNYFNTWHQAWAANAAEYRQAGLPDKIIDQIIADKIKIKPEQSFAELTRRQIEVLLTDDEYYPDLLKEIHAAPPVLYVRGNKQALNKPAIAVVGTRKMTSYGQQVAEELVLGLATNQVAVVSGLAFGIDAVALAATVKNSGTAIAVLASDLDDTSISPRSNFTLAQKILEQGCLVSEYPLGQVVHKQNFPIRNRLIAGLSLGTLVIEADAQSGALITANFALEQNREVFAVPGSIFSQVSRGTNQLIKKGAKLVTSAYDILDELNLETAPVAETVLPKVSSEEELILKTLNKEGLHINELIKTVKLSASTVNANLTLLEMKGRIKNLGGGLYTRIR